MQRKWVIVPVGAILFGASQLMPGLQIGSSDKDRTQFLASAAAQSSSERERRARERSERQPDTIRDNRNGETREITPLSRRDRTNLDECVTLMIISRSLSSGRAIGESKRLKIQGHEFKCKGRMNPIRLHKRREIRGQLSRHLRARPDDQVNYSFILSDDGTIDNVKIKYGGGAFRNITRAVTTGGGLGATKGWKRTAQLIVSTMVNRVSNSVKLAKTNRSRGQYEWGVSRFNGETKARKLDLARNQNRPVHCERICLRDRTCKSWTFYARDFSPSNPVCRIMDNPQNARISIRAVSGIVRR